MTAAHNPAADELLNFILATELETCAKSWREFHKRPHNTLRRLKPAERTRQTELCRELRTQCITRVMQLAQDRQVSEFDAAACRVLGVEWRTIVQAQYPWLDEINAERLFTLGIASLYAENRIKYG